MSCLTIYGGMPARLSLQPEYFKLYTENQTSRNKTDIHWGHRGRGHGVCRQSEP
jgi:hypothetical protein